MMNNQHNVPVNSPNNGIVQKHLFFSNDQNSRQVHITWCKFARVRDMLRYKRCSQGRPLPPPYTMSIKRGGGGGGPSTRAGWRQYGACRLGSSAQRDLIHHEIMTYLIRPTSAAVTALPLVRCVKPIRRKYPEERPPPCGAGSCAEMRYNSVKQRSRTSKETRSSQEDTIG